MNKYIKHRLCDLVLVFVGIAYSLCVAWLGARAGKELSNASQRKELYPSIGRIAGINRTTDIVTVQVGSYLYEFSGCEDWDIGDFCSLIMNSNGTKIIYDDEIVRVYYENIDWLNSEWQKISGGN